MAQPLILTDEILAVAEVVNARYRAQWRSEFDFPEIGDFPMVSPVDGLERIVRFHLTDTLHTKGLAICGLRAPGDGARVGDGNTVVLNRGMITPRDLFHEILLHEICHAVDPIFEEEWYELNVRNRPTVRPTPEQSCLLLHEQRAFTGMWIARLRAILTAGEYTNPGDAVDQFREKCREFDYFCVSTVVLMGQTERHIAAMVDDLRRRA